MCEAAEATSASAITKNGEVVSDNTEYAWAGGQARVREEREAEATGLCLSGHGVIEVREGQNK